MPGQDAGTAVWDARLSVPGSPVCAPDWLALREAADASARASELVEPLLGQLPANRPVVISDLGCGTGSMARWLAGRLPGPQRWTLHDRDPVLLDRARASLDGGRLDVRTRQGDFTELTAEDLAGTALVTTSAVLDLLTADEVDALAAACVGAGCAALWTLSVSGRVAIAPHEPLDAAFAAAFDDHQRRYTDGRRLLGPDAPAVAAEAFAARGAVVHPRPSPWRLGADQTELAEEWLRGWLGAACAQQPDLAGQAADYLRRRLDAAMAGELRVEVGHVDLLALPAGAS